jgi:hypothetical protein
MHLIQLLAQIDDLCAELHTSTQDECWITGLEQKLSITLEHLESYRLLAASPDQQQEYFLLLDDYANPVAGRSFAQRRQQAWRALLLLKAIAPEWYVASTDSHMQCKLMSADAGS